MNSKTFFKRAVWICPDDAVTPNTYSEAKAVFNLDQGDKAVLNITSEGTYAVSVNGTYVPSTQYPDYPFAKSVQTVDLTPYCRAGLNECLIGCWYQGQDTSCSRREAPGLCFEITSAERVLAFSGRDTWIRRMNKYVSGPVPSFTNQLGAAFFMRHAPEAAWRRALEVKKDCVFRERPIAECGLAPCLTGRVRSQGCYIYGQEALLAKKIQRAGLYFRTLSEMTGRKNGVLPLEFCCEDGDGIYLLIDLETETEGYLTLDIVTPHESTVDVAFGEHVDDLRVRAEVGSRAFACTCLTGCVSRPFTHYYRRIGARFLMLFIHSRKATVNMAGIIPVLYPVDTSCGIKPKDKLHDAIASVCVHTLRTCMHDHYEDCPWREQALYSFDSRNQMLAGYYAFGEFTFARESLRTLALSQREDGLMELCAPARVAITIPSFSLIFAQAVYEYCMYSGDTAFGGEMLPVIQRVLDAFKKQVRDGLVCRFTGREYWNFYEWQPLLDGSGDFEGESADAPLQLFLILAFTRCRDLRAMLGMEEDKDNERFLRQLTEGMEKYWDGSAYCSFIRDGKRLQRAELTQTLAAWLNIRPERNIALLTLSDTVPVTLSHSIFKYEAMLRENTLRAAVWDEIASVFGGMCLKGANTMWEVAEGADAFDRAGSLCHGWSAIPYYFYGAYGMGVRPVAPGVFVREAGSLACEGTLPLRGRQMQGETKA